MAKKPATKKKVAKKTIKKRISKKDLNKLIAQGKKQGYLTYDEINKALPEDMLSPDQIDETLIMFDDNNIEIIDQEDSGKKAHPKGTKGNRVLSESISVADFGTVTDPVKMYLREMGLVTLLSREGEVVIAKKIEAGEQEVLRALLETTTGVECILDIGKHIETGTLRPKHVLRDIRDIEDGDSYIDESLQIENFLTAIRVIQKIHKENDAFREGLFAPKTDPDEKRRIRRCIARRNGKIFELLKDWRLESGIADKIEMLIREQIAWFDAMNKMFVMCADTIDAPVTQLRANLKTKTRFNKWIKPSG